MNDFLIGERNRTVINESKAHVILANRTISCAVERRWEADIAAQKPNSTFLDYAICYWPDHAVLAQNEFHIMPEHESFK
jgi:hypothetical protein